MEESYIVEIQKEYKRIDGSWLNLHYKTSIGLVIFAFFVECLINWIMYHSDEVHTTIPMFIFKFLIAPLIFNLVCIIVDYKVMNSKRLSQEIKVYIVSLMFVGICFGLFTVHVVFTALYFIFAVPILLTTIYGNYKLTTITSITSIVAIIISELFIKWDNDKVNILEDELRFSNFIISLFILLAFSAVCMVVIRFEREKNSAGILKEIERYQLQQKLQIDELTGIYNRIAFRNSIQDMEEDTSDSSYVFVMIDLDNFKSLNDNYGHFIGDRCLIEFGRILKENCEDANPFRYGGDEFCILFRNHDIDDAVQICNRIQNNFKNIVFDNNEKITLTASFGIAKYTKKMTPEKLIINTDRALYEAKSVKNTIRIYSEQGYE